MQTLLDYNKDLIGIINKMDAKATHDNHTSNLIEIECKPAQQIASTPPIEYEEILQRNVCFDQSIS